MNDAITSEDPNRYLPRLPIMEPKPRRRTAGWRSRLFSGLLGAIFVGSVICGVLFLFDYFFIGQPRDFGAALAALLGRWSLILMGLFIVPAGVLLGALIGAMCVAPWLFSSSRED